MIERPNVPDQELLRAPRLSHILISEISDIRDDIAFIKDSGHYLLTDKENTHVRKLHNQVNENLVILLSLRRNVIYNVEDIVEEGSDLTSAEKEFYVEKVIYPGETVHPFSDDDIYIHVPSPKQPTKYYSITAKLSDLRGGGVSNSIEALELIGDFIPAIDLYYNRYAFLRKRDRELKRIEDEINLANNGEGKYSLEYLNQLKTALIQQKPEGIEALNEPVDNNP